MDSVKFSRTTTVGLTTRDYVVLAADKRATAGGEVYHKRVNKVLKINDYTAMTISGLVADAQRIVELARYISKRYELETGRRISISSLASYTGLILQAYLRYLPFIVQILIGGYDDEPRLYYLDLLGNVTSEKYMATGSGSPIAFGVLEKEYREDLDLETAVKLAVKAVYTAIQRDGFSGEGVDVVIIGSNIYREETYLLKKDLVLKI